jgi:hypothetical protein
MLFDATLIVCVPLNTTGTANVCTFAELFVTLPVKVSVSAAFVIVNAPAVTSNVNDEGL